jgi:hypothetical protein
MNSRDSSVIASSMLALAGVSHGVSNAYRRHQQAREKARRLRRAVFLPWDHR